MLSEASVRRVSDALYAHLQTITPERDPAGICERMSDALREEFYAVAEKWPKHSGNSRFPVPHPLGAREGWIAETDLWQGDYGNDRRGLLAWLLDQAPIVKAPPVQKFYGIPKL